MVCLATRVRSAIYDIVSMNWKVVGIDKMVQALQRRNFPVDQVEDYWMTQGHPQCALLPACMTDEIEISLAPRDKWRPVESEERAKHVAHGVLREK